MRMQVGLCFGKPLGSYLLDDMTRACPIALSYCTLGSSCGPTHFLGDSGRERLGPIWRSYIFNNLRRSHLWLAPCPFFARPYFLWVNRDLGWLFTHGELKCGLLTLVIIQDIKFVIFQVKSPWISCLRNCFFIPTLISRAAEPWRIAFL